MFTTRMRRESLLLSDPYIAHLEVVLDPRADGEAEAARRAERLIQALIRSEDVVSAELLGVGREDSERV